MNELQLFDKRGRFVMPSPQQIETLDDATRERFQAVANAAANAELADAAVTAAEAAITAALKERDAAEAEVKRSAPPLSHVQAVRQVIATQYARG